MPEQLRTDFIKINRGEAIAKNSIVKINHESIETTFGIFKLSSDIDKRQL